MPDIQSELTKVFDDWEEDAKTYQPDLQPKEQLQMKKQQHTRLCPRQYLATS